MPGFCEFDGAIEVALFEYGLLFGSFEEVFFLSALREELFMPSASFGLSCAGFVDGVFVIERIDSEDEFICFDDSAVAQIGRGLDDFTADESAQIDFPSGDDFAEHVEHRFDVAELNALCGDIPHAFAGGHGLDFFSERDEQKEYAERSAEHDEGQKAAGEAAYFGGAFWLWRGGVFWGGSFWGGSFGHNRIIAQAYRAPTIKWLFGRGGDFRPHRR